MSGCVCRHSGHSKKPFRCWQHIFIHIERILIVLTSCGDIIIYGVSINILVSAEVSNDDNLRMVEYTSREMQRGDIPQIVTISRENMAKIIRDSWGVEWDDNDLLKMLRHNSTYNEVFEIGNRIIAYYSIEIRDSVLFVNSIQVDNEYKCRGYGSEIMKRIEEIAYIYDAEIIELWVQITNIAARRFYHEKGFRMNSRQGNNYLMRKFLPPKRRDD